MVEVPPHQTWLTSQPIAHRGLYDLAAGRPENSLAAFDAAATAGYPCELDVHRTDSGELVVLHDYDLGRATGVARPVATLTVADLPRTRLFGSDEHVPTLAQVTDCVHGRVPLLIELKRQGPSDPRALVKGVLDSLKSCDGEYALSSFDPILVHLLRAEKADYPRRDGLLILDVELAGQPGAPEVAEFLYATWRWRSELRVGDTGLLDWLARRLDQVRADGNKPLAFGQNLHQCVFAGGRLARQLLRRNRKSGMSSADVVTVVFRGTMSAKRGSDLGIRRPTALNNPGETVVAHGRGVSLITGWTEPVENAFGIAAAGLVNAAGVVNRVRLQSLEALRVNETSAAGSAPEIRTLIADLSDRLNQLRLDLSFGIEAYADVVLIPELLIESYHSSLRRVAALAESVANTSRIVDRVAAVIDSRHAMLSASVQAYTERRDKIFAGAIAIGTLLALPPLRLAHGWPPRRSP